MSHKNFCFVLVIVAACLAGCEARSVAGGTKGVLRSGSQAFSEIQVTVHRFEGGVWLPIGFGVVTEDGTFQLVANGASEPLWLSPGEYRCTLQSAGAPVQIPLEYAQAEATPLRIAWTGGDQTLNLEAAIQLSP